jgi:hypothetical protein
MGFNRGADRISHPEYAADLRQPVPGDRDAAVYRRIEPKVIVFGAPFSNLFISIAFCL